MELDEPKFDIVRWRCLVCDYEGTSHVTRGDKVLCCCICSECYIEEITRKEQ
jgi:hypothetical protein